jgi:hypothetical protein
MKSKLVIGVAVPLVSGVTPVTVLAAVQPPAWIMLLLGSLALALPISSQD